MPVLAVLQPGVVSVVEADGSTNKYFVSSGSVTVNKDSTVQVCFTCPPFRGVASDSANCMVSPVESRSGLHGLDELQTAVEKYQYT